MTNITSWRKNHYKTQIITLENKRKKKKKKRRYHLTTDLDCTSNEDMGILQIEHQERSNERNQGRFDRKRSRFEVTKWFTHKDPK